jgi:hypothetical protein
LIIEILSQSFQKLWDKIGTSFISSVIAAVNPLFFLLNLAVMKLLNNNFIDMNSNPTAFIITIAVLAACSGVFPTTFLGLAMNKRIAENELIYLRHYFGDFPKAFKITILPSLVLTVIYGAAAYLIANGLIFYFRFMPNNFMKGFVIVLLLLSYAFLMMMQFILIPHLIYRKDRNYLKAFKFAASMCLAEFPVIFSIFMIDAFFFFLFAYLNGASIFLYYFVSSYFRVFLYSALVKKYPKFHAE